ncbi:hypothetical protein K491DRAFT_604054 [Lophiostoma macrostomum CBS 122681]|uniref:Uncharacterized protein n=1 Tax=Lophiostoma macrostomum CBS 122681 TaxID=1314788 RepID=A0A6A6T0N7_9PLEO|nr:hypothetical protein K491DRAFT_604054 [Lophiostoma macrostomum CBS 122681]
MVAAPVHVPAGLPSPRSPTLSCAEMILPESSLRSLSPTPYVERPPSPPNILYTHSNRSAATIKLASAPQGRRGPSPGIKSPPLSAQSSRSTLRTMGDSDGSSRRSGSGGGGARDTALLASSPTIADALSSHPPNNWIAQPQRRISNGSSSVHSDDLENMKWPGFDARFDDSGVVMDEEEEHDQFPSQVRVDDADNDPWLSSPIDEHSEAGDDDEFSSAALSRRAEMILANAKKRLNVMEGNLRGARQSLVVSPTFGGVKMASELSHQLAAARERDRRLYAGIGPIPPRDKQYRTSLLMSNNSPSHSRGLSETSVPLPFSPTYTSRIPNKRASSAMGVASGPWSPEGYGQGRFPIRESRSFEVMRDPRYNGWQGQEERNNSLRSYDSRDSRSPPAGLETLPEDDDDLPAQTLHRSSSVASDLRSQMKDLKGRISSLKMRAQEDSLRRQSMQSLRAPSPFTCAETWYTNGDAYKAGGSPVSADAGVGMKLDSPIRQTLYEDEDPHSVPNITSPRNVTGPVQAPKEVHHILEEPVPAGDNDYPPEIFQGAPVTQLLEDLPSADFLDQYENDDFVSVNGDEAEVEAAGDSVYEDAVYEMPVAERHEDRLDAFDYENFFLHSAMGTYSSASRRSSSSGSADSVATTRPVTAIFEDETPKRMSMHQRNASVDSVSTVASFATAAEEQDDDDEENEQMDQFSRSILPHQHLAIAQNGFASPRSDSAVTMRKANSSSGQTQGSRGSSPASEVSAGLQTSKLFTILTQTPGNGEPRLALSEEEKELIYGLASSFQQVCGLLQSTDKEQYERKEWRRRLDEARRMLNGEELEGRPF